MDDALKEDEQRSLDCRLHRSFDQDRPKGMFLAAVQHLIRLLLV